MRLLIPFIVFCLSANWQLVLAQNTDHPAAVADGFDRSNALEISQTAIGNKVDDYLFFTSQSVRKNLSEYKGKPLVISLIYTSCHHICPTTTKHLDTVIGKARNALGKDSFHVVTIGFDTDNDTADAMRIFAKQQSVRADNWDFLATDKKTITSFSKQLGFQFFPSASGFDHLIQTSLLDKDGVVVRQVYGIQFDTPHLIEPLKQLVFGEQPDQSFLQHIGGKIRLFCTVYDPYSDTYQFDYSIFVGLVVGLVMGGFMVFLLIREWKSSNAARKGNRL